MSAIALLYERLYFDVANQYELEKKSRILEKGFNEKITFALEKLTCVFASFDSFIQDIIKINNEQSARRQRTESGLTALYKDKKQSYHKHTNTLGVGGGQQQLYNRGVFMKKVKKQASHKLVNNIVLNNFNFISFNDAELYPEKHVNIPVDETTHESWINTESKNIVRSSNKQFGGMSKMNANVSFLFNDVMKEEAESNASSSKHSKTNSGEIELNPKKATVEESIADSGIAQHHLIINDSPNASNCLNNDINFHQFNRNSTSTINPLSYGIQEERTLARKFPLLSTIKLLENKTNQMRLNHGFSNERSEHPKPQLSGMCLRPSGINMEELREMKLMKSQISMYKTYIEGLNHVIEVEKQKFLNLQAKSIVFEKQVTEVHNSDMEDLIKYFEVTHELCREEFRMSRKIIESLNIKIKEYELK